MSQALLGDCLLGSRRQEELWGLPLRWQVGEGPQEDSGHSRCSLYLLESSMRHSWGLKPGIWSQKQSPPQQSSSLSPPNLLPLSPPPPESPQGLLLPPTCLTPTQAGQGK